MPPEITPSTKNARFGSKAEAANCLGMAASSTSNVVNLDRHRRFFAPAHTLPNQGNSWVRTHLIESTNRRRVFWSVNSEVLNIHMKLCLQALEETAGHIVQQRLTNRENFSWLQATVAEAVLQ